MLHISVYVLCTQHYRQFDNKDNISFIQLNNDIGL
jgi:hypothetical protein